ncbi:MAG: OFA family MFS transporter [Defluviitaleaceae bacterium]|nr:OFA family MFS transporter [Defluviitaleaceae bacterium]
MDSNVKKAATVLVAATLYKVSIGVLYVWTIIRGMIVPAIEYGGWGWTASEAGLPYTVAIIVFSITVIIGGRVQDKIGPRWVVTAGGFLGGLGLILSGVVGDNSVGMIFTFGFLTGGGLGLGYSSATPAALKWFHPSKKGMVSGFVIGGFGLAAVVFAPVVNWLLAAEYPFIFGASNNVEHTFIALGTAMMVISISLAQFIKNPPVGYVPSEPKKMKAKTSKSAPVRDFTWGEMIKTRRFVIMFVIFMLGATTGLMILGALGDIAREQITGISGETVAFLVAFMAAMNFIGRIIGGMLSDRIGRTNTLMLIFALQTVNMVLFQFYSTQTLLIIGIIGAGFCFGAVLAIFPALTADQFGLKNYGLNYGIVYLAWGIAGFILPPIGNAIYDANGNFHMVYIISAIISAVVLCITFMLKKEIASKQ